jgi:hypothetical protein
MPPARPAVHMAPSPAGRPPNSSRPTRRALRLSVAAGPGPRAVLPRRAGTRRRAGRSEHRCRVHRTRPPRPAARARPGRPRRRACRSAPPQTQPHPADPAGTAAHPTGSTPSAPEPRPGVPTGLTDHQPTAPQAPSRCVRSLGRRGPGAAKRCRRCQRYSLSRGRTPRSVSARMRMQAAGSVGVQPPSSWSPSVMDLLKAFWLMAMSSARALSYWSKA